MLLCFTELIIMLPVCPIQSYSRHDLEGHEPAKTRVVWASNECSKLYSGGSLGHIS